MNITLTPDEYNLSIDCFPVMFYITDDDINEADQLFVFQLNLMLIQVEKQGSVVSSRNASLGKIIDDDRKCYYINLLLCLYMQVHVQFNYTTYSVYTTNILSKSMCVLQYY